MKIETTGNSLEFAEKVLEKKVKELIKLHKIIFLGNKNTYGNFEYGYKIVQHYELESK